MDGEGSMMKPKKKRGRPAMDKNPPNPPKLVAKMRRLMEEIENYETEDRLLAEAFLELPSRKELPDYYEVIRRPVDIKKINSRIRASKYRSMDDLTEDFMHMCTNAQLYNVEGSQIYLDSELLMTVFKDLRDKMEKEEAEKAAARAAARAAAAAAHAAAGGSAEGGDAGEGSSNAAANLDEDDNDGVSVYCRCNVLMLMC